MTAFIN
jgi:hypothetical protein